MIKEAEFDELPEEEEETTIEEDLPTGYSSPLMSRLSSSRLSVEMLREEIPKVKAGEAARIRLSKADGRMGDKTRSELLLTIRKGEEATETLFAAALPLIRTIAAREWRRRQQWGSQVSLEDLTQESIIGFLKGLSGFKTESIGKSATNYLGQWMLVETRRAAEILDHDLQVGHDAGERFRRVRALRTRLTNDLGREPTDEEISNASKDPNYVTKLGMVGKAPKEGETNNTGGKGLTVAQVAEERAMRSRVGKVARFSPAEETDENQKNSVGLVDPSRETINPDSIVDDYLDPAEQIMNADASKAISTILNAAIDLMRMPDVQKEIIARRYGLPPYTESSAREIARVLGLQRDKVSKILSAFSEEITKPGGAFHSIIKETDPEDLIELGLGWTLDVLKEWPKTKAKPPAAILTEEIIITERQVTLEGTTKAEGVLAWFLCDFHDRTFSSLYRDMKSVPKTRPCPSCQKPSSRIKITQT